MRVTETRFQRFTLMAAVFIGLALGATNMFATAILIPPDGGILQVSNLAGSLVGITTITPCISWVGSITCAGASHPMNVSGSSLLYVTGSGAGMIKDIGLAPPPTLVDFKDVTGGPTSSIPGQTIHFDLTSIPIIPASGGTSCTPPFDNAPGNKIGSSSCT